MLCTEVFFVFWFLTKHRFGMFPQIWIEKWIVIMNRYRLSSGEMQLRYQFCLNQYFYKFIMLIFCCQLLCPVHLGYHIFTYGLSISLKMNRVTPPPLSTYRSHECQFWFGGSCYSSFLFILMTTWRTISILLVFFFLFSRQIYKMCLPTCFLPWQMLYKSKVLPIKVNTPNWVFL